MSGLPWGKFYWRDWLTDPALSVCSLSAQGLWIRMLCIMAHSNPVGHLTLPPSRGLKGNSEAQQVARMCLADARHVRALLDELETRGVFTRNDAGVITSRRMIRDAKLSESGREAAYRRHRKPSGLPSGSGPGGARVAPTNGAEGNPPDSRGRDLLPESRPESDSPPRGRPRSRHHRRKEVPASSRNGFVDSATSDMETHDHAEPTNARSGGATVVPITRRALGC
jgi:hypothetical protein